MDRTTHNAIWIKPIASGMISVIYLKKLIERVTPLTVLMRWRTMAKNTTPEIDALQHTDDGINILSDIYRKDAEILNALQDLKSARSRIIEVLRMETMGD